jgi:hypothetical protein
VPAPGYKWAHVDQNGKALDFVVQWEPGQHPADWPHVHAADAEGEWDTDGGYTWAHLDKDGHPTDAVVRPAPGYKWAHVDQNGEALDSVVQWEPGQHPGDWAHVHAADAEGEWDADEGYTWAHLDKDGHPTDAAVRLLSPSEVAEVACEKTLHPPIDVPLAVRRCDTSINQFPKEWQGFLDRANLRMRLDRFDEAQADLERASEQLVKVAISSSASSDDARRGAKTIREAMESLQLMMTLEPLWERYLEAIEAAGPSAWGNWSAAPWSLYKKNHQAAESIIQTPTLQHVVQ